MKRNNRSFNDPAQTKFVGILWQLRPYQTRLQAGDVIVTAGAFAVKAEFQKGNGAKMVM